MASVFRVLATIAMTAVTSKGGWKKLTKLLCTTATTFPFCDCTCERHPPPLHLAINCVVFDIDIKAMLVSIRVYTERVGVMSVPFTLDDILFFGIFCYMLQIHFSIGDECCYGRFLYLKFKTKEKIETMSM